ncbi:hypothetical protein CEXT_481571 [Caerostris extrusa]|uniref:Uncharacterized protein n=1 Tax=Caerostris extrusa TaxID=172846 RepID=A0AAV4YBU2_CAEEX|nr:hypothetical protein CEXT_481571 [Caerostris extrusa]
MSGTTYTVKSYALKNSNEPPSQVLPKKLYSVSISYDCCSYQNSYSLNQCVSQILIREKNVSEQQRNQDINCLKISFSSDLECKSPLRGKDFSKFSFNNCSLKVLKGSTFKQSDSFDFNPHIAASSLSAFYKENKPVFKKRNCLC